MAVERNRNQENWVTSSSILDRLIDGKVIDSGEFFDRMRINQDLRLIFSIPQKKAPTRIR